MAEAGGWRKDDIRQQVTRQLRDALGKISFKSFFSILGLDLNVSMTIMKSSRREI